MRLTPETKKMMKLPTKKGETMSKDIPEVEGTTPTTKPVVNPTIPTEPKPSAPVQEAIRIIPTKVQTGMQYLGTFAPNNMQIIGGCALPVVIFRGNYPMGVVVVSDPGVIGAALITMLSKAGYDGDITMRMAGDVDAPTRLAAARVVAGARDNSLNRASVIAAFGFTMAQLT